MIKPLFWLLSLSTTLLGTSCGSSTPTGPMAAGPGIANPTVAPQGWTGSITLGRAGALSGKARSQTQFASHALIELRVDVGGSPPGREVRADWLDGNGEVLGGEAHRTRVGQQIMVFPAPSPGGLDPGKYQVQVRVSGQLVAEQHFEVESQNAPPG